MTRTKHNAKELAKVLSFARFLIWCVLHLHIEGTLDAELLLQLAKKYKVKLKWKTVAQIRAAYQFSSLDEFLALYYQGCNVLRDYDDFYTLTLRYLTRAARANVRHVEMFVDPQTHTNRGIELAMVIEAMADAALEAQRQFGMTTLLIPCLLRDHPIESGMDTVESILDIRQRDKRFKNWIVALGLDSSEANYPPKLFKRHFQRAKEAGLLLTAHAGEEGPPAYIRQAMKVLGVNRLDHAKRCLEDRKLVAELRRTQMPITNCPWSSLRLGVVNKLADYRLDTFLDEGLCSSIHTDDPAYFGAYEWQTLEACVETFGLTMDDLFQLSINSIVGSFASKARKIELKAEAYAGAARGFQHIQL
jgi:adenosine deaminase